MKWPRWIGRDEVEALSVGDTAMVVRYPGQVAIGTLIVTPEKPGAIFPV